jgi:hypothetical protein
LTRLPNIVAGGPGQSQETPNGFLFPYGDYTGLILNTTCASPAPAMV